MDNQRFILGAEPKRELQLRRVGGFTLIELAVTMVIAMILLAVAAPYLGKAISTARARNVVSKFNQDFSALRGIASSGNHAVTLLLSSNCTWTATVDGSTDSSRSMTADSLGATSSGFACTGTGATALPVTFTFSQQGYVQPSATFSMTSQTGQTWPVRILGSGTVAITTGSQ